jgi:hypothetical protein
MREQGWAPDWRAWAELAVLYAGLAGILGAGVGEGVSAWRRIERSEFLQDKIREQEAVLRKGQPELERLRRIDARVKAASDELHRLTQQITEAGHRLKKAEEKAYAMEQWGAELENEKARVLQEYRSQPEREQQAAEKIAKALDDL